MQGVEEEPQAKEHSQPTQEMPKKQPRKKSEPRVRQASVPSSMYYDSSTFKILINLLQLHVSQKSIKPKTFGQLEDVIYEAMDNIETEATIDRSARDKLDKKVLTQKRMKSVRVNIKGLRKDDVYQEAISNYDVSSFCFCQVPSVLVGYVLFFGIGGYLHVIPSLLL